MHNKLKFFLFLQDTLIDDPCGEHIEGSSENERIFGSEGNDTINGNDGNDKITSMGGSDRIRGGNGNDSLLSYGDGNTTLEGNDGDDQLIDFGGSTTLIGGNGNDTLSGTGTDEFIGGDGQDTFVFSHDYDHEGKPLNCQVRDFNPQEDKIIITQLGSWVNGIYHRAQPEDISLHGDELWIEHPNQFHDIISGMAHLELVGGVPGALAEGIIVL